MCMKSPPLAAHVCTYRFWGLLQSALEAGCNPYLRQLSLAVCLAWTCVTTVLAPPCPYVYPWEGIPMDDRTSRCLRPFLLVVNRGGALGCPLGTRRRWGEVHYGALRAMDVALPHPKGLIVYPLGTMAPDPQDL